MTAPVPPRLVPPPVERSAVFGRDDERAAVAALLDRDDVGLLTVTGPGGAGKTRLALAVAEDMAGRFPDGVAFAGLASVGEAAHVPVAVGRALGLSEATDAAPLAEVVGGRTLLLIVDNFEHVTDAAPIIAALLAMCPRLKVLATSRTALGIYGERAFALAPLDRPARHQTLRGAIAWSYDLLDPAEQALFRRLGVFVGGLTLDAAAAVDGEAVSVVDRLESLVAKSLLRPRPGGEGERRFDLLEMLRAFALEQLHAGGELAAARRAHLTWCIGLARAAEEAWDTPQQRDWIERIDAEQDNLRAALTWSLDAPPGAMADGWAGTGATGGRDVSADAHDAVDAAAAVRVDGARLALSLEPFWTVRSQFAEGQRWSTRAAAVFEGTAGTASRDLMVAQRAIGRFANRRGDFGAAEASLTAAMRIARAIDEPDEAVRTLNSLGTLARGVGRMDDAQAFYAEALALARQSGAERRMGVCHYNLGALAMLRGDLAAARAQLEESRTIAHRHGNVRGEVFAVAALGTLSAWEGDAEGAIDLLQGGLTRAEANGIRDQAVFHARNVLASVLQSAGRVGEAAGVLAEALAAPSAGRTAGATVLWLVASLVGAPVTIAIDDAVGPVNARRRRPDHRRAIAPDRLQAAARLCGAAGALADIHDVFAQNDVTVAAANSAALQAALGPRAFAVAEAAGAAIGSDTARAEALVWCARLSGEAAGAVGSAAEDGAAPPGGLSEREWAVARLIAEGLTYRQIADELSVVVKTVEKHVGGALGKLGLGNRTQLAVWVHDREHPPIIP